MTAGDDMATEEIDRRIETLQADLQCTRAAYEAILVHLSRASGTVMDASKRSAMQTMATVVAAEYELKVLLLKVLAEPEDREVWLKYLVLLSHTVLEELPARIGGDLRDAGQAFKEALKPVRSDAGFMKELRLIRNNVVAHHALADGDHWLAQWHLSSIAGKQNGTAVVRNKIVNHAGTLLAALKTLGFALLAQHPDLLPPWPAATYRPRPCPGDEAEGR